MPILILSGCSNNGGGNNRPRAGTFHLDISHMAEEEARFAWEMAIDVVDQWAEVATVQERVELLQEILIETAHEILWELNSHDARVNVRQRWSYITNRINNQNSQTAIRNIFIPWATDAFYEIYDRVIHNMRPHVPMIVYEDGRITINNVRSFWNSVFGVNGVAGADSLSLPFTLGANGALNFTPHNRSAFENYFSFIAYTFEDMVFEMIFSLFDTSFLIELLETLGLHDVFHYMNIFEVLAIVNDQVDFGFEVDLNTSMRFHGGAFYIEFVLETTTTVNNETTVDSIETSLRFVA